MNYRVLDGCTLTYPDGSIWARSGEVVDIAIDSKDPEERKRAGRDLKGQYLKIAAVPEAAPVEDRQDRQMTTMVTKGSKKKDKKK